MLSAKINTPEKPNLLPAHELVEGVIYCRPPQSEFADLGFHFIRFGELILSFNGETITKTTVSNYVGDSKNEFIRAPAGTTIVLKNRE